MFKNRCLVAIVLWFLVLGLAVSFGFAYQMKVAHFEDQLRQSGLHIEEGLPRGIVAHDLYTVANETVFLIKIRECGASTIYSEQYDGCKRYYISKNGFPSMYRYILHNFPVGSTSFGLQYMLFLVSGVASFALAYFIALKMKCSCSSERPFLFLIFGCLFSISCLILISQLTVEMSEIPWEYGAG